jgi:hypothetical protein
MKRRLFAILRWLWWAAVALIPIAMSMLHTDYRAAIGCPPRGDCYGPSFELLAVLYHWDGLISLAALLLWPACAWFLLVAPWWRRESN